MISVAWVWVSSAKPIVPASEIDGGVGWTAQNVCFDFDPTALALRFDLCLVGRNRRLVRLVALRGEFDLRALFLFAHFLFGQAKRKWAMRLRFLIVVAHIARGCLKDEAALSSFCSLRLCVEVFYWTLLCCARHRLSWKLLRLHGRVVGEDCHHG